MTDNPTIFERKGYPTIKLFNDKISIKAVDISTFRDFHFDKIKKLHFYRPYDNSMLGFLSAISPLGRLFRHTDNFILRIKLKDGEHWDYETTPNFDQSFTDFLNLIRDHLNPT